MTDWQPRQRSTIDKQGIFRFKENKVVRYLLDEATKAGVCDLNRIAIMAASGFFNRADREQFAQLIGYSISGASDLEYMRGRTINNAQKDAEKLFKLTTNSKQND